MLNILIRKVVVTVFFTMSLIYLPTAAANDYFVEAVVFAWSDVGGSDKAERWQIPGRSPPASPTRIRTQADNPSVASDKRLLDSAIARLVESGKANLLMHQAWTQFRAGRDGSPQVSFEGSIAQALDVALGGWIRVYESSLLYIEVDLSLTDPNAIPQVFESDSRYLDRVATGDESSVGLPGYREPGVENRGGVTVTTDAQGNVSFSNRGTGSGGSGNGDQSQSTTPVARTSAGNSTIGLTWRINERRRVKFNEIHYIDHPKFGVLFTISRNESS